MCSNHTTDTTEYDVVDGNYSNAVVSAVADEVSVDVTEISDRLYDEINPDALDSIFSDQYDGTTRAGGRIIFTICGCEVVVRSGGVVTASRIGDADASNDSMGTAVD